MFFYFNLNTFSLFFFFFQAEDGIRVLIVTGVQTCALPILAGRRDAPDLVGPGLGEPQVAVRAGRDRPRKAAGRGERKLGHLAGRRDAPDLVGVLLREPEVAVGARRDPPRDAAGRG